MFHSQTRYCHSVWHLCTYLVVYYIKVILFIDLLINTLALAPVHSRFRNADVHWGDTTPRVRFEARVAELSEKKHWIALDEFSRLVLRFLVLGQYLTQF